MSKLIYLMQYGEAAILMYQQALFHVNTKQRVPAAFYKHRLIKFQNKYSIHVPINCCGKGFRLMHLGLF